MMIKILNWGNMENVLPSLFQGISTLLASDPTLAFARIFLILLGMFLIYLAKKEVLEPLLMVPMGLGMVAINSAVLFLPDGTQGNIFVDPLVTDPKQLLDILQIDFLQPIYTLTFSNGLIACFVFMGIGSLLDVSFILQRHFVSMFLALCAELGTFLTIPIAIAMGLNIREAASIAMVGGADGPMVLFTSMMLSKDLFVPITIVAYLYLGLTYGGYPFLIKLLVPKRLRGIPAEKNASTKKVTSREKLIFSVILCCVLCLLFPVAGPLFLSLFMGIVVRESGLKHIHDFISGPLLYGSTFFLGLLLGVLCEAHLILNPKILLLLCLGIVSLLLSGIGGILGGYIIYFIRKRQFNPVIGIAGVSCVPSTAKVAQKAVSEANMAAMILPDALGANICGVITTAIISGIYITFIPLIFK
jgi:carboxybiotin decarboxylase